MTNPKNIGMMRTFRSAASWMLLVLAFGCAGTLVLSSKLWAQESAPPNQHAEHNHMDEVICGPMALSMGARLLGVEVKIEDVIAKSNVKENGCTLADLADAAGTLGLSADGVKVSNAKDLLRLSADTPAIVQIQKDHFALIWGTGSDSIFVADYPKNLNRAELSSLRDGWDKRILVLRQPTTPLPFATGLGTATRVGIYLVSAWLGISCFVLLRRRLAASAA